MGRIYLLAMQLLVYQEDSAMLWRCLHFSLPPVHSRNVLTKSNFTFERLVNQVTTVFVHLIEAAKFLHMQFAVSSDQFLTLIHPDMDY